MKKAARVTARPRGPAEGGKTDQDGQGGAALATTEDDLLPPVIELSLEEWPAFYDAQVRHYLGMSGAEFLQRLNAGEYDEIIDDPEHRAILYLAMLGAGDRPQSG